MAKKKPPKPVTIPIDALKHVADKRPNIPTRETAAFAHENGAQPFVLNRDRSLDPQLVWKDKDEQDAKPLEVPVVSIHVQEKLHPQAIVEAVKSWTHQGKPVAELEPRVVERGKAALQRLEDGLAQGPFLVGAAPTLADVALVAYTRVAHEGGFDLAGYPRVKAWVARTEQALKIAD